MAIKMGETLQAVGSVCGMIAAAELIGRICPKDKLLGFVKSLAVLALLMSLGASLLEAPWQWPEAGKGDAANPELEEYLEDQYTGAAKADYERYIAGLLAAGGMEAKKICVDIDIIEDGSILLTKAEVWFRYESDAQRAQALLRNALGGDTLVEVRLDGA